MYCSVATTGKIARFIKHSIRDGCFAHRRQQCRKRWFLFFSRNILLKIRSAYGWLVPRPYGTNLRTVYGCRNVRNYNTCVKSPLWSAGRRLTKKRYTRLFTPNGDFLYNTSFIGNIAWYIRDPYTMKPSTNIFPGTRFLYFILYTYGRR